MCKVGIFARKKNVFEKKKKKLFSNSEPFILRARFGPNSPEERR